MDNDSPCFLEDRLHADFEQGEGDFFIGNLGISDRVYEIVEKKEVILLDGRRRRQMTYRDTQSSWRYTIIEGQGEWLFPEYNTLTELICTKDAIGSIYQSNDFSQYDCDQLICPVEKGEILKSGEGSEITLTYDSENTISYFWDLGDGTTKEGKEITHIYEKKGCYDVELTYKTDCGREAMVEISHNYCIDSLWVKQSELILFKINMINKSQGWGIRNSQMYETVDGGLNWSELNWPDFTPSDFELKENGFGVLSGYVRDADSTVVQKTYFYDYSGFWFDLVTGRSF